MFNKIKKFFAIEDLFCRRHCQQLLKEKRRIEEYKYLY
jgi:hypothetical protein